MNGTGSTSGKSARSRVLSAWLWGMSPARLAMWSRAMGWPRIRSSSDERVEQADAAAERQVDRFGARDPSAQRVGDRGGHGVDEGEVAALGAVAVDGDRHARAAPRRRTPGCTAA